MKYVVDATVLLWIARGSITAIVQLGGYRRSELGVPHPVILDVAALVKELPMRCASKRWELLVSELPRAPWTNDATERLLALGRSDLDAVTAAHALALDAHVMTTDPGRYAWADGLRVEHVYA